jgi:leucyl-tRNA synthetase
VPAEHLPWLLPTDVDFTPNGRSPLASSTELKERVEKLFGKGWTPEVDTLDVFVDSSWYYTRYLDSKNDQSFSDSSLMQKWLPVRRYTGGAEHTTVHLLYSRFFYKALFDLALVPTHEPYLERFNRGIILGPDGQKMSKSKGNVINPDEFVQKYGADAVRLYLAFIGPYYEPGSYPWNLDGVAAMRKFLDRVVRAKNKISPSGDKIARSFSLTTRKVADDSEKFKFNTAIAALMTLLNEIEKDEITNEQYKIFLKLLAPFAPHLTEHLWEAVGGEGSVHQQSWPVVDEKALTADTKEVTVQVNGKRRGSLTLSQTASEAEALAEALKIEGVLKSLAGTSPKRVIYIPGRILNLVI